ncbi:MAG: hypothetical protein KQH63_20675 [Desulfobulbaceae bacterium]|nr:hypothetical protein [Desulfobulbaceae bacterium]
MSESIPLSSFQNLADDSMLLGVLDTLKSVLKSRPSSPDEKTEALLEDLCQVVAEQAQNQNLNTEQVTKIGDNGSHLLEKLYVETYKNADHQRIFNYFALAFAYWIARNGGKINELEFAVNALAQTANILHDKTSLEALYEVATFMVFATTEELKSGPAVSVPGNPWKVLIMNYAIVATRTHTPELMESAYNTLIKHFPDDAPSFFSKAMSEMDRLNYPQHVRNVVKRYYDEY